MADGCPGTCKFILSVYYESYIHFTHDSVEDMTHGSYFKKIKEVHYILVIIHKYFQLLRGKQKKMKMQIVN